MERKLIEVIYIYDDGFESKYKDKALDGYIQFISMGAAAMQAQIKPAPEPEPKAEPELPFLRDAP